MSLKIRIMRFSRNLFIILVNLTGKLFSEKMFIFTICIPMWFHVQLDQKSWKDSNTNMISF